MNICCRQSFNSNELIEQEQSHTFEFKNINIFESNPINDFNIKKTICGMLNSFGGYLFLGIDEDVFDRSHRVRGYVLDENQKEIVKKYFNSISQCFYPIVDTSKKQIQVVFIKVNSKTQKNLWIPKIIIKRGKPNKFYSFRQRITKFSPSISYNEMDTNLFFKRYDNESKIISSMNEIYRQILERNNQKETISIPPQCHCKEFKKVIVDESKDLTESTFEYSIIHKSKPKTKIQNSKCQQKSKETFNQQSFDESYLQSMIQDNKQYKHTVITNVPELFYQEFQKIIDEFQLSGFLQCNINQGLKTYIIPLKSREEHIKLQRRFHSWSIDFQSCSQKPIQIIQIRE